MSNFTSSFRRPPRTDALILLPASSQTPTGGLAWEHSTALCRCVARTDPDSCEATQKRALDPGKRKAECQSIQIHNSTQPWNSKREKFSYNLWNDGDTWAQILETNERDLDVIDDDATGSCFDNTEERQSQWWFACTCPSHHTHLMANFRESYRQNLQSMNIVVYYLCTFSPGCIVQVTSFKTKSRPGLYRAE